MTRSAQRTIDDELLERRLTALEDELDRIRHGGADTGEPLQTVYATVEDWVRDWFVVNLERPFGRPNGSWRWCEEWFRHNEAVLRLTALWFAWESARVEQAMESWLRLLDHHLPVLCGSDGPFRACNPRQPGSEARHTVEDYPTVAAAPEGWFDWWSDAGSDVA